MKYKIKHVCDELQWIKIQSKNGVNWDRGVLIGTVGRANWDMKG